ncbi:ferredoxin [Patescibacteria group bacterium]|nr:ferredoxin [Patescibacteria group bacterium]
MSAKKIIINQDLCIGCNTCVAIDPDNFKLDQKTFTAKTKSTSGGSLTTKKTEEAISSCPINAISIQ